MKRKALKLAALALALALTAGVCLVAASLLGNPVSRFLAGRTAREYVAAHYGGEGYEVQSVEYNFKSGGYTALAAVPGSPDQQFLLELTMTGRLWRDGYGAVASGFNTWVRLDAGYRQLAAPVFEELEEQLPLHIAYGTLWMEQEYGEPAPPALTTAELEPDREYDLCRLGAECGLLVVYLRQDEVTVDQAAQALLAIRAAMDGANVPFAYIHFTLEHPLGEDGTLPEGSVEARYFARGDIRAEGLARRLADADAEAKAHWARLDAGQG